MSERFPRLSITSTAAASAIAIGPLTSRKQAALVVDAIHGAIPLRRCTTRVSRSAVIEADGASCSPFQLGTASCPCNGATSEAEYRAIVDTAERAMSGDYALILEPLEAKMRQLAEAERFEEATDYRNRASALTTAIQRQQRASLFDRVERLTIVTVDGVTIELGNDRRSADTPAGDGQLFAIDDRRWNVDLDSLDEVLCTASWLERNARSVRVVRADGTLATPYPPLPSYQPPASDRANERPLRRRRTDS